MPPINGAIWTIALFSYILQVVTGANNHLYDGSGGNEPWGSLIDCYGETCTGNTEFCCDDIQRCCSEIQFQLQIGRNNEATTTAEVYECYDNYCDYHERYCCELSKNCCSYIQYIMTNSYSQSKTKYQGQKVRCTVPWGGYTMTECPPDYDHDKLYCCSHGERCCTSAQRSNEQLKMRDESDSGQMGIGATAGFIFMGVIIVATVLTLVTRYVKIKVRRNPPSAGIDSMEYREAINRRTNSDIHNTSPTTQHSLPGMEYSSHQTSAVHHPPQDEDLVPPPSYDEAISTCPVVSDETAMSTPDFEPHQTGTLGRHSYPPLHRAPSRPVSHISDSYELRTFSKEIRTHQDRLNKSSQHENNQITLPKPDDSSA